MSVLTEALQRIQAHSKCQLSYCRPQLTYGQIELTLQEYPFKLSKEVYELYLWQDGTLPPQTDRNDEAIKEIFDFGYHLAMLTGDIELLPLEEAAFEWQTRDEWYRSFLSYEPSNIFPLFTADRGKIVVLGREVQQETSPVYWVDDFVVRLDQEPLYPSLTNMMLAIAEAIELGGEHWDFGLCDRLIYEDSCRAIDEKYGRSKRW